MEAFSECSVSGRKWRYRIGKMPNVAGAGYMLLIFITFFGLHPPSLTRRIALHEPVLAPTS